MEKLHNIHVVDHEKVHYVVMRRAINTPISVR